MNTSTDERYVLEKKLGEGGMGEVWLAKDTLLNRPVAVKFLQVTENAVFKDLFLSEARTLASLQHPNITLIYDAVFEEDGNRFYIMMEYVEGQSLGDLIAATDGPLPQEMVVNVTLGILEALQYAHKRGIVHRDIKPDNVIIQNNQVKLTDFGLAALVSLLAEQQEDYVFGTPAYMPPEQIAGEGIDGRTDLYALGVTLFEMVTGGRLPFERSNRHDLMLAHIEQEPPSVRKFEPSTPLMLERIIAKLLAKHPDDRYPSAGVVLDLFKSIQARQKFTQRSTQLLDPEAKPLLGRDDELAVIEAVWQKTRQTNRPQLLVVQGETGAGKSRLIAEFLGNQIIDRGLVAVAGQCDELGDPYAPFGQILATIFDEGLVSPSSIESKLETVTDQIPSLAPLLNIEPAPPPTDKPEAMRGGLWKTLSDRVPSEELKLQAKSQWQFFDTIADIFVELGPTTLFLDNAELLDESSAALLRYLVRQASCPLLIIAEYTDSPLSNAWLDSLADNEKIIIALKPLPGTLIQDYLTGYLGQPVSKAIANIVEKRARGLPFYIEETTRQLIDSGDFYLSEEGDWRYKPPDDSRSFSQELVSPFLINALTRRLEKISDESRQLLALAALLEPEPEFNFDIWLELLGGPAETAPAQAALDEALQRRLLRDLGDNQYAFRPADVAVALAQTIPEAERRKLHRQIAQILIDKQHEPILIGYHLEQGGQATESAHYLEAAGAKAAAANAINQAIDCYRRAVELVETWPGYMALGNLYRQQGHWAESLNASQRALELARAAKDIEQEAQSLNDMVFSSWLSDQYQPAAELASAVLKLNGVSPTERGAAQSHLGMISWLLGHLPEAETWSRKAVELLATNDDDTRLAEAYNHLGLVLYVKGQFAEATRVTEQSLAIRRKLGSHWGEGHSLVTLAQIAVDQGDFEAAAAALTKAQVLFETINSGDGLMVVYAEQGRTLLRQNQAAAALPLLEKALNLAQAIGRQIASGRGDMHLLIAEAHLALDRIEPAEQSAETGLNLVTAVRARIQVAWGWAVLAQIYAAQRKVDAAGGMYKKALDLFKQIETPAGLLRTKLAYARFLADQTETQLATQLEQETREAAAKIGLFL